MRQEGLFLLSTDAADALQGDCHKRENAAIDLPGFQALRGKAELGVSGYDGKPCLVFQYPPDTPLFGNMYDELREVAPGLYLARLYERCPCPRFRGYFAIQVVCPCP